MNALKTAVLKNSKLARQRKPQLISGSYMKAAEKMVKVYEDLDLTETARFEATKKLFDQYLKEWIAQHYPTIDLSFADKTQTVLLERDVRNVVKAVSFGGTPHPEDVVLNGVMQLPVYVRQEINLDSYDNITYNTRDNTVFRGGRRAGVNYREWSVTASTKCPDGFGKRHLKKFEKFRAYVAEGLIELMKSGINIGDILTQRQSRYDLNEVLPTIKCNLSVLWAPLDQNWVFTGVPMGVKADPAILVEVLGTTYLLDFFETADEKPIERVIREFSSGKLEKKGA